VWKEDVLDEEMNTNGRIFTATMVDQSSNVSLQKGLNIPIFILNNLDFGMMAHNSMIKR
jgi:hypothetical protein